MAGNKNDKKARGKQHKNPALNNDQLGENASEVFRSEKYANARSKKKDK